VPDTYATKEQLAELGTRLNVDVTAPWDVPLSKAARKRKNKHKASAS
jgi:hypothetical protein